jgi:hypothetical protein
MSQPEEYFCVRWGGGGMTQDPLFVGQSQAMRYILGQHIKGPYRGKPVYRKRK